MRITNLLLLFAIAASFASAQNITSNETGFLGYIYTGGPINLTRLNLYAANDSGLYSPQTIPFAQPNYTDGEMWIISGTVGGPYYGFDNSLTLPYLLEGNLVYGTDSRTNNIAAAIGYPGGASPRSTSPAFGINCPTYCNILRIRLRVRQDGWVIAYVNKTQAPARALLLRWADGGSGQTNGAVDDTILGAVIKRAMSFLNSTNILMYQNGAVRYLNASNSYLPSRVNYYDFEYPNASTLLIGGKGRAAGAYTANSYGFGFSPLNRTVLHASMSARMRTGGRSYYINGQRVVCALVVPWGNDVTVPILTYQYNASVATTAPLASCVAGGSVTTPAGNPFNAFTLNVTALSLPLDSYWMVTSDDTEFKAALWVYLA